MFSDKYLEFAKAQTISPEIFHKFISYSVLGAIAGRWAYIQRGPARCFPNLYHLIVAPSSCGKSSAIRVARKLIMEASPSLIWKSTASSEAMFKLIADNKRGIFLEDEFSTFLTHARKEYASNVKDILTSCYDSPEYEPPPPRINNNCAYGIDYPAPSFLTSTTEVMLFRCMEASDLMTGFFARFVFITPDEESKDTADNPDMILARELRVEADHIVNWLQEMEQPRVLRFHPTALYEFNEWEKAWKREARKEKYENIESNMIRLATSMLKYSMINAIERYSIEISVDDVYKAEQLACHGRNSIISLLSDYQIGAKTFAERLSYLKRKIRKNGAMDFMTFSRFFDDPKEVDRAKKILVSHGIIRIINNNGHSRVEWLDPEDAETISQAEQILEDDK